MQSIKWLLSEMDRLYTVDDLTAFIQKVSHCIYLERVSVDDLEHLIALHQERAEIAQEGSAEYNHALKMIESYQEKLNNLNEYKKIKPSVLGKSFVNCFIKKASITSTLKNALKITTYEELLARPKTKKKKKVHKPVWERKLPERPDRIGGAQSPVHKPEDLVSFFGFRGVQFGNYVSDEHGFEHLLHSSEAFMDLAEILGLSYQAMSLNGTLGIAFGARGRGGNAAAHYEQIEKVINLTRDRGFGVLSHELFHALDHYLYNLTHGTTNTAGYATEDCGDKYPEIRNILEKLKESILEGDSIAYIENTNEPGGEWRNIDRIISFYKYFKGDLYKVMERLCESERKYCESMLRFVRQYQNDLGEEKVKKYERRMKRNIKRFALALAWYHEQETGERVEKIPYPASHSNFYQAALELDRNKNGKYWSSIPELAARSFEAYIEDKLASQGRKNDYLVTGTKDEKAYPVGEERERLNKIFEELVTVIRDSKILE